MRYDESHPSDQEILRAVDGELSDALAEQVIAHFAACWTCRARGKELDDAIADFVRLHRRNLDPLLPPVAGPRGLLKARLSSVALSRPNPRALEVGSWRRRLLEISAVCFLAAMVAVLVVSRWKLGQETKREARVVPVFVPDSRFTPGAAVPVTKEQVCGEIRAKNGMVPAFLQRKVFEEYGIVGSDPSAYEVDYLITPALGGSDDIHNLWPHSYSATIWNARVKDALEDRLQELVCKGQIDPVTAQREIATNWIAAYKKYLHTDHPLRRW